MSTAARSGVYVSTGAFATDDLRALFATCQKVGIGHVELSSGLRSSDDLIEVAISARESGFELLVHNYFPPPREPFVLNLASLDAEISARSIALCQKAIDLCVQLESDVYSVHAGFGAEPPPDRLGRPLLEFVHVDLDHSYRVFIERTREIAEYADERGVRLLIENHPIAPFNVRDSGRTFLFASRPSEIRQAFLDIGHPNVGLLLDVGHLKVTATTFGVDPVQFLSDVSEHVCALHISDNDGRQDTNQPFDEGAWFGDQLHLFANVPSVIEVYGVEVDVIERCRALVAQMRTGAR